jgi:hypothetical protein
MGLERVHFAGLRGDQFVQGTQAVGDFLLGTSINPPEPLPTNLSC